ncbi:L7Ae/L30e/S12e/Gadd45 family ribosomal protein [Candidatus Izemoplasma sp. B36]|uniref:L7Ae/L30e/S12e/Gadd45 family ribosomal protein n=1 Tax=Candidatus Izemoplasma sp. B36 TaxID=3242468 RepID=UPI003557D267
MNKERILQNLGLCKKANKIVSGEEQVLEAIKTNKARIVFLASDAGKNTTKRITDKSTFYNVLLNSSFSTEDLNKAIGSQNRKVISIIDKNFAKMIISQLDK